MKTIQAISVTLLTLVLAGTTMSAAHNVSGTITCDGQGVAGIAVSDGYEVVQTDAGGHYAMTSAKKNGYVFYTLPGGYEPMLADGFNPQFWAPLYSRDVNVNEVHEFTLRRVDNDRHTVIFGADTHLARRSSDRAYFKKGLIACLNDEVTRADGGAIYSVLLGDLTWDVFWTQNNYNLSDFMADMKHFNYPMTMWPVIGNHDHDPSIPAGDNTDEEAVEAWRDIVCPNYYSFNLGKVHYVVLDDIVYLNIAYDGETYSEGVAGSRNYRGAITDEQIQWLRKDLALVGHSTPLVVCLHIPAWSINANFNYSARLDNSYTLCNLLNQYDQVHIVSGHNHCNYTAEPSAFPHVTEHNITAVCGSLWQSAIMTDHHICQDGSPAGYLRWSVNGTSLQWVFQPIHEGDSQMRLYDMNTVRDFYLNNSTMRDILNEYPSRVNYGNIEDNVVMVNVYAFSPGWQVTISEGDSILPCQRVYTEDPFHTLAYDVPRYATAGYYSTYYTTTNSTHLFKAKAATATKPVTVRVVDNFGNIHIQRISRPHGYNIDMEGKEITLLPGDVNSDGEVNIADANALINILLGAASQPCSSLLADANADGELNIADVNMIIDLILKI
ncbi:MAG: calcineurin-like phosphoesterase C-terminal domain-containing protein [Muribaculaceae bacterium]|nr:calcineurin-like phosphoesterase C-terminal domain-containing protein [Muribaculaceae bacterium]